MPRKTDTARNKAIAKRLYVDNIPAPQVAQEFSLSRQQVYRVAEGQLKRDMFQANAPGVEETSRVPTGPLFGQVTKTGLRRFGGHVDDDYNRVFRTLYKRTQLYREMGDDPIIAAVLQAVKMRLRSVGWYIETDGESDADKEARDFVQQCLDDMSQTWADTIDQALDMIQYGFQPAELVYKRRAGYKQDAGSKYDDGRIGWRKWTFISPDSLQQGNEWIFDVNGGIQGLRQLCPPNFELATLSIEKAILFRTTLAKNNPEGRALLRAMYSPWYFKKNLEEIEAISAERLGAGLPVIYAGKDVGRGKGADQDMGALYEIVKNVRADEQMGVVIPFPKMGAGAAEGNGVLFELLSPPGRGAVHFHETITRHEQRMAMVGLAQFIHLGMNQVGARSLGETAQDFFTLSLVGWLDNLSQTIGRYGIDRLMRLNHFPGLTSNPYLAHESVMGTNLKELAETVNTLVGAKVLTPTEELERHILELADLPQSDRIAEVWEKRETEPEPAPVPPQFGQPMTQPNPTPPNAAPAEEPIDQSDNGEDAMSIRAIQDALLELRRIDKEERESDRFTALLQATRSQPTAALSIEHATFPQIDNFEFPAPVVSVPSPTVTVEMDTAPIADALLRIAAMQQAPQINVATPAVQITPNFTVPSPTVIVQPAAPNITVEFPETQEITEVKRDDQGYITQTVKTHRKV